MSVAKEIRSLCHGCLSTDRILYSIEKQDYLHEIIKDNHLFDVKSVLLCWECAAVLMKMKLFKEQVSRAANILLMRQRGVLKVIPNCLSKLSTHNKEQIIIMKHEMCMATGEESQQPVITTTTLPRMTQSRKQEIKEEFDDIDLKIDTIDKNIDTTSNIGNINSEIKDTIKIEFDNDTKDDNGFDNEIKDEFDNGIKEFDDDTKNDNDDDDELLMNIKTKKEKARIYDQKRAAKNREVRIPRSEKYKFIKDLKELIFKDKIDASNVQQYIEMERSSEFYLKAKYKCEGCVVMFKSEASLNEHKLKIHDESLPYKCAYCQSCYSTEAELQEHTNKHLVCFRCKGCTFESYTRNRMKTHIKLHRGWVKCNLCEHFEKYFKNCRVFYKNHYMKYHKSFICDTCGRSKNNKVFLIEHLRTHIASFSCDQCGATFTRRTNLNNHMKRHLVSPDENSYCVLCDKQFDSRFRYEEHYRCTHEKWRRRKKHICPVCNKEFSKNISKERHYNMIHLKKTDYYCVLCDKYFIRDYNLRLHIAHRHEGKPKPKNKICDTCGRGFTEAKILRKHMRTHTNSRPYKCPYCPAAYNQCHPLKKHLPTHHHQGPFPYFIRNGVVTHISQRET